MSAFDESIVEQATMEWLEELGYATVFGPDIAPDETAAERTDYGQVVLIGRLREALGRINPRIPSEARAEAIRKVLLAESPSLIENNRRFHKMLVDGVDVEYRRPDGSVAGDKVWLVDFKDIDANDWLAVNQFTIIEDRRNRRPDVLLFVNGLPLVLFELKNAAAEEVTVKGAFNQVQTYKKDIPSLFVFGEMNIVSDGLEARLGTLTGDWERFAPWRTIDGVTIAPRGTSELETLVKGVLDRQRLLDLIRHFIIFEDDGQKISKKLAGYHQYHAVNKAVTETVRAAAPIGDRRVGVIWHTQGSGKSLSMVFYAGKVILDPAMNNPTLVVLTDRNDLDEQLFTTFGQCKDLLRQTPVKAENRGHLRKLLSVGSGGVVFTTIQKFLPETKGDKYPLLSDRRNIVVIADEAHRSQYAFIDGFARHLRDGLPKASFIGFTGTPIEADDRSTRQTFGDYIDVYDIQRSVEDGATVRIYYEGRLAKLELKEEEKPRLDPQFEEVTEGEEQESKEKLKSKWARLEAMVGTPKRIALIAKDLVDHWEKRLEAMDGKAMIVCMSRRICVDLYDAIIRLRPQWHDDGDDRGVIKIVMTGSADDPPGWQGHIRNKARREAMAKRFKDPADPMKLVIVRDMWLTGFDAPCLHTMYADKPMQGHGLMQAIARVNRVFRDKPGGLVVDYLGLADQLKKALADYTDGDRGEAGIPQEEAVEAMLMYYEVCLGLFNGFNWDKWTTGTAAQRLALLPAAQEHVLKQEEGRKRCIDAVTKLSRAFALAVPHDKAIEIRDDVGFFQVVKAALLKTTVEGQKVQEDLDAAVRQLVSKAVTTDGVVDIFAAAGLKNPDISILSDEFLAEVRGLPYKNVALELLRKLLNDEIKTRSKKNVVQGRSFAEMLEATIRKYQNRSLETAQVIAELIKLAKQIREAGRRGEQLGLNDDELAFYDALEVNDSAVKVLGDANLRIIARELVETVRKNVTIDWAQKENVRARLRIMVKRILRKYGYPPDKQEKATKTVLEQAEVLCRDWAA